MARFFEVHPENPQQRALDQVVTILRDGGVIAYPTDSGFALGSLFGNHSGADRIRAIRELDERHHMTVVVSEFGQLGRYVDMDNRVFRAIKATTPGPYTFILRATREVPRIMQHPKKRTIGVRVPSHVTTLALLDALGEPLVSSTLIAPGETEAMSDGWQVKEEFDHLLDAVLDSGDVLPEPTTVIDLTGDEPEVTRRGAGDPALFEA
ncbi:MAG: L-threonylcarbamoyladenylate synthase [Brooklawnia sp.]|uniref:L-threonylcarbamoyladenylate synthase n=1 Tax=Brooklawnia sp. TaxID=2699740 RepID=UPI003C709D58